MFLMGGKSIDYSNIEKMRINEYLKEKDKLVLSGDGDLIKIANCSFAIFFLQYAYILEIKSCG